MAVVFGRGIRTQSDRASAAAPFGELHGHWASPPRTATALNKSSERPSSKAHVGYWVVTESGELPGAINSYMTTGLRAVVSRAFRQLRLHRLEANIQPDMALLVHNGLTQYA